MEEICIYVLTHKEFDLDESEIYVPLLSGSSSHNDDFGYLRDDTGDNISDLNEYYAELTGEYWVWKNSKADIIGFCHYRRYLAKNISFDLLDSTDITDILSNYDLIMPNRVHMGMSSIDEIKKTRKYLEYGPYIEEYSKLRNVIEEYYPDYLDDYNAVMNSKECYWFNMFICKKELADNYFEWLFDILEKMMDEIDFSAYPKDQRRILGFLSERLINVYIRKNNLNVKEKPLYLNDFKFPILYVSGYRLPIIVILFKVYIQIKYYFKHNF